MHNTNIVCTLGPVSASHASIEALVGGGMAVARFNAGHGSTDERATLVERVQDADKSGEASVATMLDLSDPEIRTAPIVAVIELAAGSTVKFVADEDVTPEEVGLSASLETVEPGDRVLLDGGAILVLPAAFDDEFDGDPTRLPGIVNAHEGVTGYPAIVARELDIPMVSAVSLPDDCTGVVTLDVGRGIIYEGARRWLNPIDPTNPQRLLNCRPSQRP